MHPRRLLAGWEAEDGVCDQQVMLGTGLKEQKAIAVTFAHPVFSNYAIP